MRRAARTREDAGQGEDGGGATAAVEKKDEACESLPQCLRKQALGGQDPVRDRARCRLHGHPVFRIVHRSDNAAPYRQHRPYNVVQKQAQEAQPVRAAT